VDVRDVGLRGHADDEIASYAKTHKLIVLSADLGFGNILRFPIGSHPGIAVARFPNEMPPEQLNHALATALRAVTVEELRGKVLIIEPGRVRLRTR
jgi:predicted nuclease of predicted toxin-antitoxin system